MVDLSQSQYKLSRRTHTHTHPRSGEFDEVTWGCETCFILIARPEKLVKECCTIIVWGVCFLTDWCWDSNRGTVSVTDALLP